MLERDREVDRGCPDRKRGEATKQQWLGRRGADADFCPVRKDSGTHAPMLGASSAAELEPGEPSVMERPCAGPNAAA